MTGRNDGATSNRSGRSKMETAGNVAGFAFLAGAGLWHLIRGAIIVAGLILIVAGYRYSHSDSFKVACGLHKLTGASIGTFKNMVCDADFTIDAGSN